LSDAAFPVLVKFAHRYVNSHVGVQLVVAEGNMAILHSSNFTGLDGQFWELRNWQKSFQAQGLSKIL